MFDTFVNGTHPLLPWLAFFCAGIVLGRVAAHGLVADRLLRAGPDAVRAGHAALRRRSATGERAAVLASTDPFDRGLLYDASALGTALIAFAAVSWLADRFVGVVAGRGAAPRRRDDADAVPAAHRRVQGRASSGSTSSSRAASTPPSTFAAVFWIVAIAAASWYHRRFGIGPAEYAYRRLGG